MKKIDELFQVRQQIEELKKRDIQLVSEINTILSVQNINEFQYKNCRIKVNNLSLEITEVNENEKK